MSFKRNCFGVNNKRTKYATRNTTTKVHKITFRELILFISFSTVDMVVFEIKV